MDLGAWVTLANGNGVGFPAAHAKWLPGRVNRETAMAMATKNRWMPAAPFSPNAGRGARPATHRNRFWWPACASGQMDKVMRMSVMAAPAPAALEEVVLTSAAEMCSRSSSASLKLYRIPGRTTVASRQSKQVRLMDRFGIPVRRVYGTDLAANREAATGRCLGTAADHGTTRQTISACALPSGRYRRICGAGRGESTAA